MPRAYLLSLATVSLLIGCAEEPASTSDDRPVIRPVRYADVVMTGGVRQRIFSGTAQAGAEVNLSFRVPGTISEVNVEVGDRVRTGQVIARLDRRDYELQVEDVQAALAQARAQARNADADLERVRGLYENSNVSRDDLDAALAAAESFGATVRSVEKRLELAELQLSYCDLIAGVDGAVAEVRSEVNENVGAGQVVVLVNAGSAPEVELAVPENAITQVREGSRVTVRFDALGSEVFSAVVTEVGVSPTRSATTFPVRVRLDESDSRILAGMAAEATFSLSAGDGVSRMVVPAEAVGADAEGNFVYVVESAGTDGYVASRRRVEVGQLRSEGMEILGGLRVGERVITAGVNRIEDGQVVRIEEEQG